MGILVYHPNTRAYAEKIGRNLSMPRISILDYSREGCFKGSAPLFIGRNGDNHHNDLKVIKEVEKTEELRGRDISVGLFDAHTDILVKNVGDFDKDIDRIATYANWAALGLANGNFGTLSIVGCINGRAPHCEHHGTQFISRFSPDIIPKIQIYPAGPSFKTVTTDRRGIHYLNGIQKRLCENVSVRDSWYNYSYNELHVEWKGAHEAEPFRDKGYFFGSIDLDVLGPGLIDSDWSGRGMFSLEDLMTATGKFKRIDGKHVFSITGLKEGVEPDKGSVDKLTELSEFLLS